MQLYLEYSRNYLKGHSANPEHQVKNTMPNIRAEKNGKMNIACFLNEILIYWEGKMQIYINQ